MCEILKELKFHCSTPYKIILICSLNEDDTDYMELPWIAHSLRISITNKKTCTVHTELWELPLGIRPLQGREQIQHNAHVWQYVSCISGSQKCDIRDLYEDSSMLKAPRNWFPDYLLNYVLKPKPNQKNLSDFVPRLTEGVKPGVIQINNRILIYHNEARISHIEL